MKETNIRRIFEESGTIITGSHFVYAMKKDGWYHGSDHIDANAICLYPRRLGPLCKELADRFGKTFEVVVGGTANGASLAQWTAYYAAPYQTDEEIISIFTEEKEVVSVRKAHAQPVSSLKGGKIFHFRANGAVKIVLHSQKRNSVSFDYKIGTRQVIKRECDALVAGKRCLVVGDMILTGETIKKTIRAIRQADGEVIGVGVLCNSSGGKVTAETLDVSRLESLLNVEIRLYKEANCPICRGHGVESVRTDLGEGKEFLVRIGRPIR